MTPRVALVSYSTRPRGGVVHTLQLAKALQELGEPVHVIALGDPAAGWFTDIDVASTIVPAPPWLPTLERRVFAAVDALADHLRNVAGEFDILHAQDCISARAAARVRDEGEPLLVARTVHHVDDFTTQALIDCQRAAILEPDRIFVVSRYWHEMLTREFGVEATIVSNGVDAERFAAPPAPGATAAIRARVGATERPLVLAIGGIEPRKGSADLLEAMALLKRDMAVPPVLAVVGGQSFQDHRPYREAALKGAVDQGLSLETDVVLAGTIDERELPTWYHAADLLAFPSTSEGWGLVVLEALAASLPAVVSDIPVFREYLGDGEGVLIAPVNDPDALATRMRAVLTDPVLAAQLARTGPDVSARYPWSATARQHLAAYAGLRLPEITPSRY